MIKSLLPAALLLLPAAAMAQTADPAAPAPAQADPATTVPTQPDTAAMPAPAAAPGDYAGGSAMRSADPGDWTGPYAGIHGGYGFDDDRDVTDQGATANNFLALGTGIRPTRLKVNRNGFFGGAQAGYNLQSGRIVYGGEADFSYTDIEGSKTYRSSFPVLTFPAGRRLYARSDLDWIGTVRARAGYMLGSGLIYVTGGYAYGRIKGRAEFDGDTNAVVNYAGRHKYVAQGWTAGGGLEFKPFPELMGGRISVRAEALYYDLGRSSLYAIQTNTQPGFYRLGFDTRGYNGRVGINYHF